MSLYTRIIDLQKLREAWNRVKKNKPACGADSVTYEIFDNNLMQELKQLHIELEEHSYEVFPVKLVKLKKEEKVREVSLYTMRDKTVQASLTNELMRIYEHGFSRCTYAYRNDLSAMIAIERIEEAVRSGKYDHVCKTDIKSFFDCISLEVLQKKLGMRIKEQDVIELIMASLRTPSVNTYGELTEKARGIYQGAGISPVLSNIYMNEFDKEMEREDVFFVRYADDMLLLSAGADTLHAVVLKMKGLLSDLCLELNQEKTFIGSIAQGFDYLGYHFDTSGKSIPQKATERLETSLEDVWLTSVGISMKERLKQGSRILNGWEQYYRGDRAINNIFEYVVLAYMMRYKAELSTLAGQRKNYCNSYKDIAVYLLEIWKETGRTDLVLLEYEQYFGIAEAGSGIQDGHYLEEMLGLYEKLWEYEDEEKWADLMQAYSDQGCYDCSEKIMDRLNNIRESREASVTTGERLVTDGNDEVEIQYDSRTLELMEQYFRGREDMYTREILTAEMRRKCEFVPEPLTRDVLKKHLDGQETVGTYLVRNNDTVHYIVIDLDISRKVLLEIKDGSFKEYLHHALEAALTLVHMLHDMGIKGYIEFSGYRGYHVWVFFTEWIPIRYAYSFLEIFEGKAGALPEGITMEMFPARNKKKSGSAGQNMKLPFGLHIVSGERSCFLGEDLKPVTDCNAFLSTLAKYSCANLKRVIAGNISEMEKADLAGTQKIVLNYEALGELEDSVKVVLEGCNLMKYLVHKSMSTGYLSHFERLSILNVFGHVGTEGKEFVHKVMSFTLNYQYAVTQKFITRIPEKPISCIKLRDQYKQVTAEYGCSCVFKRTKNCYPSPVIHALRQSNDENREVTIPTSRTLSAAKKDTVYEELNVHVRVQDLAEKIVELKKQRRGIEKSIKKVEKDLVLMFDQANVDCMEVDMGMLIRRKRGDGYEWIIEI